MSKTEEIITVAEALTRVGLADLIDDERHAYSFRERYVAWTGYPKPFACGHTARYGFGPLRSDMGEPEVPNDNKGSGRAYQELVRVNQHHCSGDVLFSWASYAKSSNGGFYQLNSSVVVSIDEIPDYKSMCLKVGFTA